MVDRFTTEPFDQRESQHLGFGDFVKRTLIWAGLPFIIGTAFVIFGKLTKWKVPILDGSPTLEWHFWEELGKKGEQSLTGHKREYKTLDRLHFMHGFGNTTEQKEDVVKGTFNFMKGLELGGIISLFHFWKQGEKHRLDLLPARDRLQALNAIKPTDTELAAENASLKQQLAFVENRHPGPEKTIHKSHTEHHGMLEDRALEHTV